VFLLQLLIKLLEENLPLAALHLLVAVEKPGNNLLVLELYIALQGRAIRKLVDFFDLLLNLIDLVVEGLLFGVWAHMTLLESHRILVQVGRHRNGKETQQRFQHRDEKLAVAQHPPFIAIVLSAMGKTDQLEVVAKHGEHGVTVSCKLWE
jgi:hypothetical protein